MAAFLIVHLTVRDPDRMQTYAGSVGPTLTPFGGELLTRGAVADVLIGEHAHKTAAVLKFPDLASLRGWYHSDAYQALVPNRLEAADMTFIACEEPSA